MESKHKLYREYGELPYHKIGISDQAKLGGIMRELSRSEYMFDLIKNLASDSKNYSLLMKKAEKSVNILRNELDGIGRPSGGSEEAINAQYDSINNTIKSTLD